MATIFYTGLGNWLTYFQHDQYASFEFIDAKKEDVELSIADIFIIGPEETEVVKAVQQITAIEPYLSIIVITAAADLAAVKRNIQFAPFVGKNTLCIAYNDQYDFKAAFDAAVLRTTQRRSFHKINKKANTVTSISVSAVKVEDFGTFLEQAPIGALLIDGQNKVVAINKKGKYLFNLEETHHYSLQDIFPAVTIQDLQLGMHVGHDQSSKIIQYNNQFLELHLSEVKNYEDKPLHIILVSDVTAQKRKEAALTESESTFRFMAEAMPQKVWTADGHGKIQFFNQHWTDYTGMSKEDLQESWYTFIHPDDASYAMQTWQHALDTGEAFEIEERIKGKDDIYRWHLVRGVPRKNSLGEVLMWVGTNTDIHQQKEFAAELERSVHERTYELEKSNSELEQFVYITSHDLQEPLRKIRMFSEILVSNSKDYDTQVKNMAEKISATALRMNTLLKELLNFTQMSKQEQLEDTDLNTIVSKAIGDLELAIMEKSAAITIGHLPVIKAIPVQMHQLFYNLLNNAIKFSHNGQPPAIKIAAHQASKQDLQSYPYLHPHKLYYKIIVQDNGIGFDQQYAEKIFNIFQRLHNRNDYAGTGIGLALCKKVVTNHHGAIYAMAEKGRGAAFHILLPSEQ